MRCCLKMRDQFKGARQILLSGYFPLIREKPLITENHFGPPSLRKKIRRIILDGVLKDNDYFLQIATAAVSYSSSVAFLPYLCGSNVSQEPPHANLIGAALQQSSKFICTPALGHFKLIIAWRLHGKRREVLKNIEATMYNCTCRFKHGLKLKLKVQSWLFQNNHSSGHWHKTGWKLR